MMGSGTTVLEAAIAGRQAVGYDIDPLSLNLCKVKTSQIQNIDLENLLAEIILNARKLEISKEVEDAIGSRFDQKTKEFIDYWFQPKTQRELMALVLSIEKVVRVVDDKLSDAVRDFFILAFSSIIVTKSGGVSVARDLAHGRPHRVNDKSPKNAIEQFQTRALKNKKGVEYLNGLKLGKVALKFGDARDLKGLQPSESVNLVVTSPPYANAIDYMRAHKFSLVWLGKPVEELSRLRSTYIGSERTGKGGEQDSLPLSVEKIIERLAEKDKKQSQVLKKYFLEMQNVLQEMHRVLKPDSAAIVVVGSSTMRGMDVMTHQCLADIAARLDEPFEVVGVVPRRLDRNKRMMPARFGRKSDSMIEQRMHEEYVIGLYKP
jgi:DNA modification methylase